MSTPHPTRPDVWPLRFISVEAVSGLVLLAAAAIALACANSPLSHAYESLWQQRLSFGVPFLPAYDLRFWVNDGLGILGGIGFTRSVFIANLAFEDRRLLAAAKLGVLVGSALAATVALTLGRSKFAPAASSRFSRPRPSSTRTSMRPRRSGCLLAGRGRGCTVVSGD